MIQVGLAARNAMLTALAAQIGAAAQCRLFGGTMPATNATADAGPELVIMNLPASPFTAPSGGSMSRSGTWSGVGTAAAGAGTDITYGRIFDDADVCHYQFTVGEAGPPTFDAGIDNSNVTTGQTITVTTFSITDGSGPA